jgi:hypothetical protein
VQGLSYADLIKVKQTSKPVKQRKIKGWGWTADGEKVEITGNVSEMVGAFDSKLGSARRSRKGRTYRAPNGYARYYGDHKVTSYILY